jgi:hypothetical protein
LQGGSGRGLGTRRAHLGRAMPRLNRVPLPLPRHGSQPRGHLRHGPEARQPCQRVTRRRAVPFAEARRAVPRPVRRGRGEGGRLGCPWGLGGNLAHRHTVGHALRGLAKVGLPEHGCTCRWCPTGNHPWDPPPCPMRPCPRVARVDQQAADTVARQAASRLKSHHGLPPRRRSAKQWLHMSVSAFTLIMPNSFCHPSRSAFKKTTAAPHPSLVANGMCTAAMPCPPGQPQVAWGLQWGWPPPRAKQGGLWPAIPRSSTACLRI